MLIIGLTGGIGSGKSTVAAMLGDRGAHVIDCDALGREVIAPGGRAEQRVLAAFGPSIADADGHVHRPSLATAVFRHPERLAQLTAISHPAINEEIGARLDLLPLGSVVVLDMAILVESNLGRLADGRSYSRVVTVEAPSELRVRRAVARGMAEADVRARIDAQASDADRRAVADHVVHNDGELDVLRARVEQLWTVVAGWAQSAK